MDKYDRKNTVKMLALFSMMVLSVMANAAPSPYSFGLDHFLIDRNLSADSFDNFNDGVLASWDVGNGTATEAGGLLTLKIPGDISTDRYSSNNYLVTIESSEVGSTDPSFDVADGAGDFTATMSRGSGLR